MLDQIDELDQPLRAERAVDDTVIARHRDGHALADLDLTVDDDRRVDDGADREDAGLGRIQDRGEPLDAEAAPPVEAEAAA